MRLCKHRKKSSIAFIKYFSKRIWQMKENFVYLLLDWNRFSQYTSRQSYFLLANQNVHLTTHEPIKIRIIKVEIKLKFMASTSEGCVWKRFQLWILIISCRKIPKSSAKIRTNVPLVFRWGYVNTDKVLYCRWGYVNTEKILLNLILSEAVDKFCESVVPFRFLSDKTTAILEIFIEDTIGNL